VDHSYPIPSHQASFQESSYSANDDNLPHLPALYTIQGAHSLPAQLFATSFITGENFMENLDHFYLQYTIATIDE